MRNSDAVAADVSRLKLFPRRNNERTDVHCYNWNAIREWFWNSW